MKSYEINVICDTDGCDSIETSEPASLADAENQIFNYCEDNGWVMQDGAAVCPDCINLLAKEQEESADEWR